MTAESLLKRFDLITETPGNMPVLRRLIVHLALQGRLLDKSGEDMRASEILGRIAAKKEALIKDGKLKKQRPLPPVSGGEMPGGYTAQCVFERLGNLAILEKGPTGIRSAQPGEYPLVVTAETKSTCDHYDFEGAAAIIPMVSSTGHGSASLKRLHYHVGRFALGNILCAAFPISEDLISARFLYEYLTAFRDELLVSRMIGTANVSLTIGKIGEVPIPIVSPAVQRRVDELMVLCDRLEAAQAERERRRDRLAAASLQRLNQPAADASAFREHARFHLRHLPRLTTRPEQIPLLRQTILSLAVQGRLSADWRDANACRECVAQLLDELRRDHEASGRKTTRVSRGANAARNKGSGPDGLDLSLMPALPGSWCYARADDIVVPGTVISYGIVLPGPQIENGVPYVRGVDIEDGRVLVDQLWRTSQEIAVKHERSRIEPGDVLLCVIRHLKVAIAPPTLRGANLTQGTVRMRPSCVILGKYLAIYLESPYAQGWMKSRYFGMDMPRINVADARAIPVPVPPIAEQQQIVSKVEESMALCERLEEQLRFTHTESRLLLESVLHHTLIPAS